MQGNIRDMAVPDLIQHTCQDRKTARVTFSNGARKAMLFFKDGEIIHASLGNAEGEEVVYKILSWKEGTFTLENGVKAPKSSIKRSWTGLLLLGAQRLDEEEFLHTQSPQPNLPEVKAMATRSEKLASTLAKLLTDSSDIEGIAVVGTDGLVLSANVPQKQLEEEMVGAVSAAILGLSNRSAGQLKRGTLARTLIQGEDGNIIVASLNADTLLVGLTPKNVNLGMVFMEIKAMVQTISEVL